MLTEDFSDHLSHLLGKELRGRLNNDLILFLLLNNHNEVSRPRDRGFRGFRGSSMNSSAPEGLTTREIADELGIPQSTAATAVKRLKDDGFVIHSKGTPVKITDMGKNLAQERLKHHRLLEVLLVETLGLDHELAHNESLKLMLVASCDFIRNIDERFDQPDSCPNGEYIPENENCERNALSMVMH